MPLRLFCVKFPPVIKRAVLICSVTKKPASLSSRPNERGKPFDFAPGGQKPRIAAIQPGTVAGKAGAKTGSKKIRGL